MSSRPAPLPVINGSHHAQQSNIAPKKNQKSSPPDSVNYFSRDNTPTTTKSNKYYNTGYFAPPESRQTPSTQASSNVAPKKRKNVEHPTPTPNTPTTKTQKAQPPVESKPTEKEIEEARKILLSGEKKSAQHVLPAYIDEEHPVPVFLLFMRKLKLKMSHLDFQCVKFDSLNGTVRIKVTVPSTGKFKYYDEDEINKFVGGIITTSIKLNVEPSKIKELKKYLELMESSMEAASQFSRENIVLTLNPELSESLGFKKIKFDWLIDAMHSVAKREYADAISTLRYKERQEKLKKKKPTQKPKEHIVDARDDDEIFTNTSDRVDAPTITHTKKTHTRISDLDNNNKNNDTPVINNNSLIIQEDSFIARAFGLENVNRFQSCMAAMTQISDKYGIKDIEETISLFDKVCDQVSQAKKRKMGENNN